jgi:hypothetical protein
MTALIAIATFTLVCGAFGAFSSRFGAEDRPGFDERHPLS